MGRCCYSAALLGMPPAPRERDGQRGDRHSSSHVYTPDTVRHAIAMKDTAKDFTELLRRSREQANAIHMTDLVLLRNGTEILTPVTVNGTSGWAVSEPTEDRYTVLDWGAGPDGGRFGHHWHNQAELMVVYRGWIRDEDTNITYTAPATVFYPPTKIHAVEFGPDARAYVIWTPGINLHVYTKGSPEAHAAGESE